MANVKYLSKQVSSKGIVTWACNPSSALKRDLQVAHVTKNDKATAIRICEKWQTDFEDYQRGISRKQYINENSVTGLVNV